ncbi:MAG TPA: hypothetical protein PLZ57_05155 [Pseudobdellovibrionaceae bacterium]|nr:hypothetical protein [Pseudobdellovibrionaceae bacterium]
MRRQRGSSSIESLVSLALLFGVTASGGGLAYASFTRLWCERLLREAAVCLQSADSVQVCESQARLQLQAALPESWQLSSDLRLFRNADNVLAELDVMLPWVNSNSSIESLAPSRDVRRPMLWKLRVELPRSWPESRRTGRRGK